MAQEEKKRRGYAVGVQLFDRIRERGSVYVDKTECVWKMVSTGAVNFFLSRPRRFGKSLLVDTLRCYFEGRKELFEGLYIYNKEKEWKKCGSGDSDPLGTRKTGGRPRTPRRTEAALLFAPSQP